MSDTLMPFGKHKGRPVTAIPTGYLRWLIVEGVNLSTGLASAVRAELVRRGVASPPPPPEKPLPKCREHPGAEPRLGWLDQSDRRRVIRAACPECRAFLGIVAQTAENRAKADANSDPAALLKLLVALEDRGITVTRRGRYLYFTPPAKMTAELWALEQQCRGLLLDTLPDGRPASAPPACVGT